MIVMVHNTCASRGILGSGLTLCVPLLDLIFHFMVTTTKDEGNELTNTEKILRKNTAQVGFGIAKEAASI